MDQQSTNSASSDDEWVDAQSSVNFTNGSTSSVLLSPSPSSSSTSSVFSPGSAAPSTQTSANSNNGTNTSSSDANADEELTPELISQGWRKCFSRRENRYYFFNHLTNKSLWELPGSRKR